MIIKNNKNNRNILEDIFSNPPKKEFDTLPVGFKYSDLETEKQIIDDLEENHYNGECICNKDNGKGTCFYADMINLKITKKELLKNFAYDK